MTKRIFTIITLILGIITGSMANLTTKIVPQSVVYDTNENVKVLLNTNDVSTLSVSGKSVLPLHYDEATHLFYSSPTLSMSDLKVDTGNNNYIGLSANAHLDTNVDNTVPMIEFVVDGDDEINQALKCLLLVDNTYYLLDTENNSIVLDNVPLTKNNDVMLVFKVFYELEETTIDMMNNATGSNIEIQIYAYTKGE